MSPARATSDTPAMRQYRRFKEAHPHCILFFRMGDFYELFFEDAKIAHKVLGVTLTQRTKGVPMAGVPYHAVENYLRRIIVAGYRVAVCDQVEDPRTAKGIVRRDVTRVITPGTLTDDAMLEESEENPLAAVTLDDDSAELAWADLSTGSFHVARLALRDLPDEVARVAPRELLFAETADGGVPKSIQALIDARGCASMARPAWQFGAREAQEILQRQFEVKTLEGFGFEERDPVLRPAAAIVHYLLETQVRGEAGEGRIPHLRPPRQFTRSDHLVVDQVSLRSLEVERTIRSEQVSGSLLGVLQDCRTPMGKRLLLHWLCYPLARRDAIEQRQSVVAALVEDATFLDGLGAVLNDLQDVQRMIGRFAVGRASPRDLVALCTSAGTAAQLADLVADRPTVAAYHRRLDPIVGPLGELASTVAAACVEAPPGHLREGGLFRDGHDA